MKFRKNNLAGLGQTAMIISLFISIGIYLAAMDTSPNNPFEYKGGGGDMLSSFFNTQTAEVNNNVMSGLPQSPATTGVNPNLANGNAFGFVDGLLLIMSGAFSFVKMLVGVILAPIILMNSAVDMPMAFKIFIAVPLQMLNILGIISLVRGVFSW